MNAVQPGRAYNPAVGRNSYIPGDRSALHDPLKKVALLVQVDGVCDEPPPGLPQCIIAVVPTTKDALRGDRLDQSAIVGRRLALDVLADEAFIGLGQIQARLTVNHGSQGSAAHAWRLPSRTEATSAWEAVHRPDKAAIVQPYAGGGASAASPRGATYLR